MFIAFPNKEEGSILFLLYFLGLTQYVCLCLCLSVHLSSVSLFAFMFMFGFNFQFTVLYLFLFFSIFLSWGGVERVMDL